MAEAEAWVMIPKLDSNGTGCVLDMRPLVLCKHCKHRPKREKDGKDYWLDFPEGSKCPCHNPDDYYYSWYPDDDFFCGYGERKEGAVKWE